MTVLNKIACLQGRRDEVPNQELARELAETKNIEGIQEIATALWNLDPNIQSDCVKVLYEIGYLNPELIAGYVEDFLKLLKSRNNRLVWGSMLALSTIASLKPAEIDAQLALIQKTMEAGSVITVDNGVKILSALAVALPDRSGEIFPYLLKHLATCRPKDVPQHSEKILAAVDAANKTEFIRILEGRMQDLSGNQVSRVRKVIKEAHTR